MEDYLLPEFSLKNPKAIKTSTEMNLLCDSSREKPPQLRVRAVFNGRVVGRIYQFLE